jgi:carbamate kinase
VGRGLLASGAGELCGVEAVIDKDHAAALLAEALEADVMLLLTDVPAVWSRWPMSAGRPIPRTTSRELRSFTFAAGSMGPKVEAAYRFVERTGRMAAIGAIDQAEAILEGAAGTIVQAN